jgi:hypothetical protein
MQSTSEVQQMNELLSRVADELRDLAHATDRLHCLVDHVKWSNLVEKNAFVSSAQGIDGIEQRLSALSDFISALAALTPPDLTVEGHVALRKIKLADLAARLCNQANSAGPGPHVAGELEFFG